MKKTSLFAVMAAIGLALACNSRTLDDAGIAAKVKGKLAEDSQTSAIKIGVSTTDGVVTLSGTVPTGTEKTRAEQIARQTDGVKKVVDDITVDPNSIGATNAGEKVDEAKKEVAETAKDKLIEGKIQSKLVVAGISGATVDVQNGEVVLKGAVKTQAQKTEAEDLARNTDGVTKVTNDLSVGRA
jgi:osmotically-inducible protein OsmY